MITVTDHAVRRYQERVADVSDDEARSAMTSPAVICAADFGAPFVRLGTGQRIVIHGHAIITVLPADKWLGSLAPGRDVASNRRIA